MAGCAKKHGMPCNCGRNCRCKDCGCKAQSVASERESSAHDLVMTMQSYPFLYPDQQLRGFMHNPAGCHETIQHAVAFQNAFYDPRHNLWNPLLFPSIPQLNPQSTKQSPYSTDHSVTINASKDADDEKRNHVTIEN